MYLNCMKWGNRSQIRKTPFKWKRLLESVGGLKIDAANIMISGRSGWPKPCSHILRFDFTGETLFGDILYCLMLPLLFCPPLPFLYLFSTLITASLEDCGSINLRWGCHGSAFSINQIKICWSFKHHFWFLTGCNPRSHMTREEKATDSSMVAHLQGTHFRERAREVEPWGPRAYALY